MLSDCKGVYLNSKNHFNTFLIPSFVLINAQVIDCLFLYCVHFLWRAQLVVVPYLATTTGQGLPNTIFLWLPKLVVLQ